MGKYRGQIRLDRRSKIRPEAAEGMTAGADGNKRKPRLGENDIPLVRQVEYHFPLSAVVFLICLLQLLYCAILNIIQTNIFEIAQDDMLCDISYVG